MLETAVRKNRASAGPRRLRQTGSDEDGTPLYRVIYKDLEQGIKTGRYPVMSLLPTEHALCARYGASRHTIREAIRMLTEAGMVSRRRGVGTRVEADMPETRYTQQISELADLFQYISNATLQVRALETVTASDGLAGILGCERGQAWLHIDAIKLLGDKEAPVAAASAYVHPDYSALGPEVVTAQLPLSQLIEQRYSQKIRKVNQVFSAAPIKGAMARTLQVTAGTAGLVITRRYYGTRNRLVLVTVTTFPYQKMKYSMWLSFR